MNTIADDLQEPDETRPAKRVRLEAPLDMTAEVEEEMIDDEDLYGTPADTAAADARDVIGEPDLKPAANENAAQDLPNSIAMSDTGVQADINGFATPQLGDDVVDAEDLYGEGKVETAEGLPAEAVDNGEDEFVAPPEHVEGEDGIQEAMMEETSRTEAELPVPKETVINGEHEASEGAVEKQKEVKSLQQTLEGEPAEDDMGHIAPPRSRPADDEQSGEATGGKVGEQDFYGSLESALKANGGEETATNDDAKATTTKAKDDPEFLEAAAVQKGSETAEWQFDSSDAESSSSDSDTSDTDSDSDSGSEDAYEMLDPATAAKILMSGDGEEDEGKEKGRGGGGPRTANEVKDEVVPKPDVKVTEDMKVTLLGTIDRTVENMALIQGATPGEYQVLESGSVLCNAAREVIGVVADTFGKVQQPMYSVAFTNAKEIEDMGLAHGTQVFYVDAHSTFVFTQPLKGLKGTDASNIHDEEVGEDEMEFSDDEEEAEFKRQKKQAKRGGRGNLTRTDFNANRGGMRTFGAPGHDSGHTFVGSGASDAPQTNYGGGMSYDEGDAQDDFYQPLKRPDNLSTLMASGRPPPLPSQRGGSDRGRGRGRGRGDRGRGDRGRGDRGRGRGGFNQRGQHHNADGPRGGHGQNGQRGGRDQANGPRGAARSFPDRHNNDAQSRGQRPQHGLPSKPHGQQSPTPPQSSPQQQYQQYPPFPPAQPPQHQPQVPPSPRTYPFNGYTFEHPVQPPAPAPTHYQQPQNQQAYYQNYQQSYQQLSPTQQQSPGAQFPAGAYVNPAFWAGQQQQQAQQYTGWGAQAQQAQQYGQYQGQAQAPVQGQGQGGQADLANILRVLQQQGQGQR